MQVDYASAALFLNISAHVSGSSEAQVAWWQHPELRMKNGLDPRTQAGTPCAALPSTRLVPCVHALAQSPVSGMPPLHSARQHIHWHPSAAPFHLHFWPSGLTSLQECMQDVDRYSPAWWYADVPETAIIPLRKLEAVLPYLRQVTEIPHICDTLLALSPASPAAESGGTQVPCKWTGSISEAYMANAPCKEGGLYRQEYGGPKLTVSHSCISTQLTAADVCRCQTPGWSRSGRQ